MPELWQATYIVLWAFVLLLGIVVIGLARQLALLHARLGSRGTVLQRADYGGLPKGVPAPRLDGHDVVTGATFRLDDYRGRDVLLAFVRPNCAACDSLIEALARSDLRDTQDTIVITSPDRGSTVDKAAIVRGRRVVSALDRDGRVARDFAVELVPMVYLIDSDGRIAATGIANTASQIEVMLYSQRPLEFIAHSRASRDTGGNRGPTQDHTAAPNQLVR
jgi:methylamine dehydrogenase accessory protein MauD